MSKRTFDAAAETDERGSSSSSGGGAASATLSIKDMLPPLDMLDFYVIVDVPLFLKQLAKALSNALDTATIWLHNSKERIDREHAAGKSRKLQAYAGLCVDTADASGTFMAISRVPLPFDKVVLNRFEDGVRVDEIGVTLHTQNLLHAVNDIKEYKNVILYKLKADEKLVLYQVSQARDPVSFPIPLLDVGADQKHDLYRGLDIMYELTLPAGMLQEAVARQTRSKTEVVDYIKIELRQWAPRGLTLVIKPNFAAMQVLFAPLLAKHMAPTSVAIMRRLEDARKRFDAMDPARPLADRRLECGIDAVEVEVRDALFKIYDELQCPPSVTKPARKSTMSTPLDACEDELRDLFSLVNDAAGGALDTPYTAVTADDALLGMHVALLDTVSTTTAAITDAPVREDLINGLKLLYSVSLSAKTLTKIFKQTGSSTVMLAIPKEAGKPLSIKYDLGATDSNAFIAWVVAPVFIET